MVGTSNQSVPVAWPLIMLGIVNLTRFWSNLGETCGMVMPDSTDDLTILFAQPSEVTFSN